MVLEGVEVDAIDPLLALQMFHYHQQPAQLRKYTRECWE